MPYATPEDLETALGYDAYRVVGDLDGDGVVDDAAVDAALEAATSIIDSYLAKYVPLATVPSTVVNACVTIANHKLRVKRDRTTEDSRRDYDDVIRWLRDVACGKAELGLPTATDPPVGAPEYVETTRQFSRGSMRGVL